MLLYLCLQEFILNIPIYFQNRLRGSGHSIAAARMDAKLNVAGWISEQMGGVRLEYFVFWFNLCILQFHLFTSAIF